MLVRLLDPVFFVALWALSDAGRRRGASLTAPLVTPLSSTSPERPTWGQVNVGSPPRAPTHIIVVCCRSLSVAGTRQFWTRLSIIVNRQASEPKWGRRCTSCRTTRASWELSAVKIDWVVSIQLKPACSKLSLPLFNSFWGELTCIELSLAG